MLRDEVCAVDARSMVMMMLLTTKRTIRSVMRMMVTTAGSDERIAPGGACVSPRASARHSSFSVPPHVSGEEGVERLTESLATGEGVLPRAAIPPPQQQSMVDFASNDRPPLRRLTHHPSTEAVELLPPLPPETPSHPLPLSHTSGASPSGGSRTHTVPAHDATPLSPQSSAATTTTIACDGGSMGVSVAHSPRGAGSTGRRRRRRTPVDEEEIFSEQKTGMKEGLELQSNPPRECVGHGALFFPTNSEKRGENPLQSRRDKTRPTTFILRGESPSSRERLKQHQRLSGGSAAVSFM